METFVRLLPGLIALIVAWIVVQFAIWLGFSSIGAQLVLLIVVWVIVTLLADRAFRGYGRESRGTAG
jgi:hypothetical protein